MDHRVEFEVPMESKAGGREKANSLQTVREWLASTPHLCRDPEKLIDLAKESMK